MANLKSWAEASASPQYQNASQEQQAVMRDQFKAAGGVIPEEQTAQPVPQAAPQQSQQRQPGILDQAFSSVGQGASNFLQSAGANVTHGAAQAIGGLAEMVEDKLGSSTDYGKRIQQNANDLYQRRMSGIEEGIGKTAGNYAGIAADIGLTVANPLAAAVIIAGRETGRAYAEQDPTKTGGEKSATNALLVGSANYAAQRILPGTGEQVAKSLSGRIAQGAAQSAVAGAKGGAVVGAAEALNENGDDTTLGDVITGTAKGATTGAAYGGAIGGVHSAFNGKGVPTNLRNAPDHVKTQIGAEQESIMGSQNIDDLATNIANAKNSNAAGALDLLDKNGFRLSDAVALDNPEVQNILRKTQAEAEKAATTQAERSNTPGVNPLSGPNRQQGKAFADTEHNQIKAVDMINAMKDKNKNNVNRLNDVLDEVDDRLRKDRVEGTFTGTDKDATLSMKTDRDFIEAAKNFYHEASTMKPRGGEDFDLFIQQAKDLQALYDSPNLSPEMRAAADKLQKVNGMQDGFTPIQDAHVLNDTARIMSSQDSGWTTKTVSGFKENAAPDLNKIQKLPGYLINRVAGYTSRNRRVAQQEGNSQTIKDLASSDLAVSRSRRATEQARQDMENPPQDQIPFETTEPTRPDLTPQENVPATEHPVEAAVERRAPTPDGMETPFQRYQREQAEKAQQAVERDLEPEARQLTSSELSRAPRAPERVVEEPAPAPEPTPEPVPEAEVPRQLTAQELAELGRRVRETRRQEPEPAPEPVPEVEQPRELTAQELADVEGRVRQLRRQEPEPEPVQEPTPEPQPEPVQEAAPEPAVTARELVAARRQAREANREVEARKEAERQAKAEQEAVEEPTAREEPKAEPLPPERPKAPEEAPEPVKPKEGSEKLANLGTHEKAAAKSRVDRFARTLATAKAKAKATVENFLAYKGDWRELQRRIRNEDQAANTERLEEMAKNQLASQQGIAAAKSRHVRDQYADWVKERGMPEKFAREALKAEEKGIDGNVTSLDSLKRRAERLYQKQQEADFNKAYEEALKEERVRNPGEAPVQLKEQRSSLSSEVDNLLKDELMSPAQKSAIKERMGDYLEEKFRAAEKSGREDGFEPGQMRNLWEGMYNEYKRQSGTFLKANKEGQYKMAADAIAEREKRLTEALTKRQAQLEARAQVKRDVESTKAMGEQASELDKMIKQLPEELRDSTGNSVRRQLEVFHRRGNPAPPEQFRSMILRMTNDENRYLERQSRVSNEAREAAEEKFNRMMEQAEELNRKYDVEKRSQAKAEEEAALKKNNDASAVQLQRDDIHSRLMNALEDKGITGDDAQAFAGSYMDNRYSLLNKPMTPTEHQNARSRIEGDVDKFAKKFKDMNEAEREVAKASGGEEPTAELHGEDTVKATKAARDVEAEADKLREELEALKKAKSGLSPEERAEAEADTKEALKKVNEDFITKVETAFKENKDLDELAKLADLMDKYYGSDNTGSNRRFVSALKSAASVKKSYPNNPEVWMSKGDYQDIARLGAGSAGGNKGRALSKVFGINDEQAARKLLGEGDVAKMKKILDNNEGIKTPKFRTSTATEIANFLDKFDSNGNALVKKGSLTDRLEKERSKSRTRLRVRSRE